MPRICREDLELIKFFSWIRWQEKIFPEFAAIYHVPNESGKGSIRAGRIMKQKGRKAGVPDVNCDIPRGEYHGLKIEFKLETGTFSEAQISMMKLFHSLGYCVRRARNAEEAISITKNYVWPMKSLGPTSIPDTAA